MRRHKCSRVGESRVPQQQRAALIRGKTPGKADRQRLGIEHLVGAGDLGRRGAAVLELRLAPAARTFYKMPIPKGAPPTLTVARMTKSLDYLRRRLEKSGHLTPVVRLASSAPYAKAPSARICGAGRRPSTFSHQAPVRSRS